MRPTAIKKQKLIKKKGLLEHQKSPVSGPEAAQKPRRRLIQIRSAI